MRHLGKRLLSRWTQFHIETAIHITGVLGLIVNLAYMGRLRSPGESRVVVFVDSQREAALLQLLGLVAVIPRCSVCVIRQADDLHARTEKSFRREVLLVATSRVYLNHYQVMAVLRKQSRMVVI